MLAKLSEEVNENLDLFLNQALVAAIFSPYYMVFGKGVVLPIDNLLKSQKKYMGEDFYWIMIERQHYFCKNKSNSQSTKERK